MRKDNKDGLTSISLCICRYHEILDFHNVTDEASEMMMMQQQDGQLLQAGQEQGNGYQ